LRAAEAEGKSVRLVAGNTAMGVAKYFDASESGQPPEGQVATLDLRGLPELAAVTSDHFGLVVGGPRV